MNSKDAFDKDIRKYKIWGNITSVFGIAALIITYLNRRFLQYHSPEEMRLVQWVYGCTLCGSLIIWGSLAYLYSRLLQRLKDVLEEKTKDS